MLLRPLNSSKHTHTHIPDWCLVFFFSQERDVARQVDSGDIRRPVSSAVRAQVPHDAGRDCAVDGQAGHISEAILGEMMIF